MNKYQEAIKIIDVSFRLVCGEEREDGYEPTTEEFLNSMNLLKDLANKADSFEWIPVSERLPKEHDSIFAKLYGTDKWNNQLWRTVSDRVLVTIKYDDGTRIVNESCTRDGKWSDEKRCMNCKVEAWMPLPKAYKGKDNETR